nr:hypothetical protein [Providencia rettgeri]
MGRQTHGIDSQVQGTNKATTENYPTTGYRKPDIIRTEATPCTSNSRKKRTTATRNRATTRNTRTHCQ